MFTTVDDLLLFDQALYDDSLISKAIKKSLFELRDGAVDGTFAYGWSLGDSALGSGVGSRRIIATNGQINGFNAVMVRIPDDKHLIVLLNNTGETELLSMAENIMRVLYGMTPANLEAGIRYDFYRKLQDDSLDEAMSFYREQREKYPNDYIFFPWPLRILAGQLMADGKYDDAIALLELNLETNPNDAKSFESLAQANLQAGDVTTAIQNFRKSLLLDNSNMYAADMLQILEE